MPFQTEGVPSKQNVLYVTFSSMSMTETSDNVLVRLNDSTRMIQVRNVNSAVQVNNTDSHKARNIRQNRDKTRRDARRL